MKQKAVKSKPEALLSSNMENMENIENVELPEPIHKDKRLPFVSNIGNALKNKNMAQAQRVTLVQQIGQSYGNRHVQRLLAAPSPKLVNREIEHQFKPAGDFALEKI